MGCVRLECFLTDKHGEHACGCVSVCDCLLLFIGHLFITATTLCS